MTENAIQLERNLELACRLFQYFIRSYYSLMLHTDNRNTKWTNAILGVFEQMGRNNGYYTDYERERRDLEWRDPDEDELFLHVEHENSSNRIEKTIDCLDESPAFVLIGIVYPESESQLKEAHEYILEKVPEWSDDSVLLMIFDSAYYRATPNEILGRVYTNNGWKEEASMRAFRDKDVEGYYYTSLV